EGAPMSLTTEEPLIEASALAGFPGAPFSAAQVRSAADSLRTQAGWHIAPTIEQTVEVYTGRGRIALLPSLHVVDVLRVEDASNGREVTGWRVRRQAGLLVSRSEEHMSELQSRANLVWRLRLEKTTYPSSSRRVHR